MFRFAPQAAYARGELGRFYNEFPSGSGLSRNCSAQKPHASQSNPQQDVGIDVSGVEVTDGL